MRAVVDVETEADALPRPPIAGEIDAERKIAATRARATVASILAIVLFVLSRAWPNAGVLLVLGTFTQVWCGLPFYRGMIEAARARRADMNTLIALGTTAAYAGSILTLFVPHWLVPLGQEPLLYLETSAVILAVVLVGQLLEQRALAHARDSMRSLLDLRPRVACRRRPDGGTETVPTQRLAPGDRVLLENGDRIPADGILEDGEASIDESMLNGDDHPAQKSRGHPLFEGTLVAGGRAIMEVCRVGTETMLYQSVELVGQAHGARSPVQRLVDRVAGWVVRAAILLALVTALAWLVFGDDRSPVLAMSNFVAVLIVSCPCALGLATPLAMSIATGLGASEGILVQDPRSLETLERIDTVVFDKAGTLTCGVPAVHHIAPAAGVSAQELLQAALDAEQKCDHPLAVAILDRATVAGLTPRPIDEVRPLRRLGILARAGTQEIRVGRREVLSEGGVRNLPPPEELASLAAEGLNPVLVAVDDRYLGLLGLAEIVRVGASEVIRNLRAEGLHVVLLTGDHRMSAQALGRMIGVDEVIAEVLPMEKEQKIRELQAAGRKVAMVGDGMNDALALAVADVGIAVGMPNELGLATRGDLEVATASADITLVRGNPFGVLTALRLSRAALKSVRGNLFFAVFYNLLMIPLATGLLYPWGITLHPTLASIAMALSSATVVHNSRRLRRVVL